MSGATAVEPRARRFRVCAVSDLAPGERLVRELNGRSVGIFNVDGRFYALHNRCPHRGGALCLGPVTGTTVTAGDFRYGYDREGRIIRCAWHGWEFEIETGRALVDPKMRARTFPVVVEDDDVYVLM
ncbi:MAG: Rieske (2Fe-2S) protein [Actinomycetota bacterium]|nr:Rieske (2Fe-2S) protein [Actinomycetota bacterium]